MYYRDCILLCCPTWAVPDDIHERDSSTRRGCPEGHVCSQTVERCTGHNGNNYSGTANWRRLEENGPCQPGDQARKKKRNSEIPALPSPKHRRSQEFQAEDFTIGQITLSTAEAHVILTSFIHGHYDLTMVARETQSQALLCRFSQANPDSIVTPSSAALPMTERMTLKILARCIAL